MGRRALPSSSSSSTATATSSAARFLVRIAYDGAAFRGFQRQLQDDDAGGCTPSVSFCLEHAAGTVLDLCCHDLRLCRSLEVRVGGYSRTDAGTHAAENACLLTVVTAEAAAAAAAEAADVDVEAALASLTAESLDAAVAGGGVCPGGGGVGGGGDASPSLRVLSCE
eukprot:Rhum_TRINITY_DN14632_c16_g1::Rhum_TRINITY_DN14632_c16_g1_i1::g.106458::m.106458